MNESACWILSTPRTGGNYLSCLLNLTGWFPKLNGQDRAFDEWLSIHFNSDAKLFQKNPPACLNIHFLQYQKILNAPALADFESIIPGLKYIVLKRRDVLAQAVSFYIAKESGTWRLYSELEQSRYLQKNLDIHQDKLLNAYEHVKNSNILWDNHISGREILEVFYEDLRDNPEHELLRIAEYFSKHAADFKSIIESANKNYLPALRRESPAIYRRLSYLLNPPKMI